MGGTPRAQVGTRERGFGQQSLARLVAAGEQQAVEEARPALAVERGAVERLPFGERIQAFRLGGAEAEPPGIRPGEQGGEAADGIGAFVEPGFRLHGPREAVGPLRRRQDRAEHAALVRQHRAARSFHGSMTRRPAASNGVIVPPLKSATTSQPFSRANRIETGLHSVRIGELLCNRANLCYKRTFSYLEPRCTYPR